MIKPVREYLSYFAKLTLIQGLVFFTTFMWVWFISWALSFRIVIVLIGVAAGAWAANVIGKRYTRHSYRKQKSECTECSMSIVCNNPLVMKDNYHSEHIPEA